MIKVKKVVEKFKHYLLNLVLIWLAILFYNTNSYYQSLLRSETKITILYLAIAYTVFGFVYYLWSKDAQTRETKGTIIFKALKRMSKESIYYFKSFNTKIKKPFPKIEKHEKTALLFLLVKIFFLPIMLNFFFANYNAIKHQLPKLLEASSLFNIHSFNLLIFPFLLTAIFLLDTLWFSFGYAIETKSLKNTIRSVDPSVFGWLVALACYPPFNGMFTKYVNWFANDYVVFYNDSLTLIMRIVIILLLGIYVAATFALGAKCSNLTNRGIVSRGPYSIIRHPAYISKNLAWWLTIIPVLSITAVLSMATWSLIYHLRTITEERHLIKDPDYVKYCKKVKYKYIPGIY